MYVDCLLAGFQKSILLKQNKLQHFFPIALVKLNKYPSTFNEIIENSW